MRQSYMKIVDEVSDLMEEYPGMGAEVAVEIIKTAELRSLCNMLFKVRQTKSAPDDAGTPSQGNETR